MPTILGMNFGREFWGGPEIGRFLVRVGVDGVGGIFPFFSFSSLFLVFFVFFRFSSLFFVFVVFLLLSWDKGERLQFTGKIGNFIPTPSARPRSELPDEIPEKQG